MQQLKSSLPLGGAAIKLNYYDTPSKRNFQPRNVVFLLTKFLSFATIAPMLARVNNIMVIIIPEHREI